MTSSGCGTGGLVGFSGGVGAIRNSYATGSVNGTNSVGGLIGENQSTVDNSYATGDVTGTSEVGALIGQNSVDFDSQLQPIINTISNSYATGLVTGSANTGGLIGLFIGGNSVNNFWNMDSTGQRDAFGDVVNNGVNSSSNTQGLTNKQFGDINHYLDGTINQVIADRQDAAEIAGEQAAATQQTAEPAGSGPQTEIGRQSRQNMGDTMRNLLDLLNPANLFQSNANDQLVYSDLGGGYSARIKSIFANGVEYQVEDNGSGNEDNGAKQ